MDNQERSMLAERCIVFYADITNSEGPMQSDCLDLLVDMMHFCSDRGVDFESMLETARSHYEMEINPVND